MKESLLVLLSQRLTRLDMNKEEDLVLFVHSVAVENNLVKLKARRTVILPPTVSILWRRIRICSFRMGVADKSTKLAFIRSFLDSIPFRSGFSFSPFRTNERPWKTVVLHSQCDQMLKYNQPNFCLRPTAKVPSNYVSCYSCFCSRHLVNLLLGSTSVANLINNLQS